MKKTKQILTCVFDYWTVISKILITYITTSGSWLNFYGYIGVKYMDFNNCNYVLGWDELWIITWLGMQQASQNSKSLSFFTRVLANILRLVRFSTRRHKCKYGRNISLIGWLAFYWCVSDAFLSAATYQVLTTHACKKHLLINFNLKEPQKW